MQTILGLVLVASLLSVVSSIKEWKNFENGKVYSRKMSSEQQDIKVPVNKPVIEERLLHSHHKDKSRCVNLHQTTEVKVNKNKNTEKHRQSVEEELHLRPLNERHHKFPNPELLDKSNGFNNPSSKVSRHTFLQQVRRKQNRMRARGGKRLKRNKTDHKSQELLNNNSDIKSDNVKIGYGTETDQEQSIKQSRNAQLPKSEPVQYSQIRKEGYPVKQTSYW